MLVYNELDYVGFLWLEDDQRGNLLSQAGENN